MRRAGGVLLAAALGLPAEAQMVSECSWIASVENLVEPWNENSRSFAEGRIRIARLDTGGEPACCSSYLAVLLADPEVGRTCHLVSGGSTELGFLDIHFDQISAVYDPAWGLSIFVPVVSMAPDGSPSPPVTLEILVNQALGSVEVSILGEAE